MWSQMTKWGSIIILFIVIGTIILTIIGAGSGVSTWLGDEYLPKKFIILEKYPLRIIVYGQFTNKSGLKVSGDIKLITSDKLVPIIEALNKVPTQKGTFDNNYIIKLDSTFNSKEIRSSAHSVPKVVEEVDVIDKQ